MIIARIVRMKRSISISISVDLEHVTAFGLGICCSSGNLPIDISLSTTVNPQHNNTSRHCRSSEASMFLVSTIFLALTSLAHAAHLTVSIAPSPQFPNPATLSSSTHALLLGPAGTSYDVPIRRNSAFVFPDLDAASYLLTIHSRDYFFPPLRIDVTTASEGGEETASINAWQTFRGNEWSNKGPSYGTGKGELTVQVTASGQKDYYQPRGGFNVLSFLKSPMILMGLVSVVFIFGMPYLMENSTFQAACVTTAAAHTGHGCI